MRITSSVMLWTLRGTFEERVQIAARAGMQSIELVTEYSGWSEADLAHTRRIIQSFGLTIDALLATPDWIKRPVSMVDPAQREGFLSDVGAAIRVAQKLEIPQIILMSGNAIAGRTW